MDQEQHARAAELFLQAVNLPADQKQTFLQQQCGSDAALLHLLEALLAEDQRGSILPPPPHDLGSADPPDRLIGRTLSHYRIVEPIAGGAMGAVYRAVDTRLERSVALKFLRPSLIGDPASRERFLREARAVASIDHPNVCAVYDIAEAEGLTFLVMAYLSGTPLSERLAQSNLTLEDSVDIALQTAHGLEAAHLKGFVHRDIKPANLMLLAPASRRPLVRILDFGIAQWSEAQSLTDSGLTLGTVSYMAPEQTVQSRVDARADLWSLGVVLYQLLAGSLPFRGAAPREVLAAIAGPQPADLSVLPALPPRLLAILQRLLAKDVALRYQSATELIVDLESVLNDLRKPRPLPRRRQRLWLSRAVGLTLLLLAALGAFRLLRPTKHLPKVIPITFYLGDEVTPAISPDSRQIAYAGQGQDGRNPFEIYLQLIGSTDPLRLTTVQPGFEDRFPVWHPAGTTIAFLRAHNDDRLARALLISALGGAVRDLGIDNVLALGGLAWHSSGHRIAYAGLTSEGRAAIFELALNNHTQRQLTFPLAGQSDCCPQYDPIGDKLAFKRNDVELLVAAPGRNPIALPVRASWPGLAWSADGRSLFYSWYGKLAQIDLTGKSTIRTDLALGPNVTSPSIRGDRMAFVRWEFEHSIWAIELKHTGSGAARKTTAGSGAPLILSTARDDTPQFSPDGQYIAFASERSGSPNIWIGRRDGSNLRPLTQFDTQSAGTPRWSPDSQWLAFDLRQPSAKPEIYLQAAVGGEPRQLTSQSAGADVPSWSQDGRWIYFHSRTDDQIWKLPRAGGKPSRVTSAGGFEGFESKDAQSLYYSKSDGASGIWRLDLASGREAAVRGLAQAGAYRHWALAPSGVYFVPNKEGRDLNPTIQLYDFASGHSLPVATVNKLVTAGPGALAVSPDETALLYVHSDRDNRDVALVENFH